MGEKSLKELVEKAIEEIIVDGKLVVEDDEGNRIEDLSINIKNDEDDFDDEDEQEDEGSEEKDEEEDE